MKSYVMHILPTASPEKDLQISFPAWKKYDQAGNLDFTFNTYQFLASHSTGLCFGLPICSMAMMPMKKTFQELSTK